MESIVIEEILKASAVKAIVGIVGTIVVMFAAMLCDWLVSFMQAGLFDYVTNWMTIPVLSQVILWGQAISIVVVVCIRIAVGINKGIIQDEIKAPEYLFKSVASVVLIAAMPVFCSLVISFGQSAVNDLAGYATHAADVTDLNYAHSAEESIGGLWEALDAADDSFVGGVSDLILGNLLTCGALLLLVVAYFELMVRQFQILVVSVIAPWVGIKVATENESNEYWAFLANLFGMFLTQAVQTLFVCICIQQFNTWREMDVNLLAPETGGWYLVAILFALLFATLSIPSLLDRWTFSGSTSSGTSALVMLAHHKPGAGLAAGAGSIASGVGGRVIAENSYQAHQAEQQAAQRDATRQRVRASHRSSTYH